MASNREICDNFEDLQRDFLSDLSEDRIDRIENLILDLSSAMMRSESSRELARLVHSIKGEAGAFEFGDIGTLCHKMEDQMSMESLGATDPNAYITSLLQFNDRIREKTYEYSDALEKGHLDSVLSTASESPQDVKLHRVLVVENSRSVLQKIVYSLKDFQVDISFTNNGYEAFGRLLQEKFDSLITQRHSTVLDGMSLISALRNTHNPNRDIMTILMTSSLDVTDQFCEPTHILKKGAQFSDDICRVYTAAAAPAVELSKHEFAQEYLDHNLVRVLMIDDSQSIHDLARLAFKVTDHLDFQSSFSGREGLEKAKSFKPDLILLDCQMPDMDGFEVLAQLSACRETAGIPVIFVTGREGDCTAELGDEPVNVCGIVTKPFLPKRLPLQILQIWKERGKACAA